MSLSQEILEDLILHLSLRPGIDTRTSRDDSWMTATEIASWIKQTRAEDVSPELIDKELLAWWRTSPNDRLLRPAKYPGARTLARLWGHVSVVRPLPDNELQSIRTDPPVELEQLSVPLDAPQYFVAYAAPDLHLAARIRLYLASIGIRAWLYSGEIESGDLIFEGVHAAIKRSRCALALLTPLSLASAWLSTELATSKEEGLTVICVFDGNNQDLMRLLSTWSSPRTYHGEHFDNYILSELKDTYAKFYSTARVEKYISSASSLLFGMGGLQKRIYPRRPREIVFDASIGDFEDIEDIPGFEKAT